MGLREDVNAGLKAIGNPNQPGQLALDETGGCLVPVPLPPSVIVLADGQLLIKVQMASTGNLFSLLCGLASLNGAPSVATFEALARRQFYAEQVRGVSLAINGEQNTLVAVYHWMLEGIAPDQFKALFQKYVGGVLGTIHEVNDLARREKAIRPIHPGRP